MRPSGGKWVVSPARLYYTERRCVMDVTCKDCGRQYQCTPWDDYYNATNEHDGVCTNCLLIANNIEGPLIVVDPDRMN